MKRYDVEVCNEYARCDPLVETFGGDYCLVDDIVNELNRRIGASNTLPEQQLALEQMKKWIDKY